MKGIPSMNDWTRRSFLGALPALPFVGSPLHAAPAHGRLRAGAAKSNMTLPLGANNGGVILRGGPAKYVHDELHARCLVLDDDATQLAFVVCDLRMISRNLVDRAKELAAAALGWPSDHMLVAATHTHAAPGLVNIQQGAIDRWYADFVVLRISDAIRRAAAQLAPARVGWGSIRKPEHVFNRRWKVNPNEAPPNPFGDRSDAVVTNPTRSQIVVEPAGPVDPELSVLSVQHADGRPLAVLANYGLHYVGGYTPGSVSADYFAVFADRVGQLLGEETGGAPFVGMMSNGASGDVNNVNHFQPAERSPPWQKMQTVAEDLAHTAARLCRDIQYRDAVTLAAKTRELELSVRRPNADRLRWAREMVAGIQDRDKLTRPQVYAEEAIALAEGPERVSAPLQAVRIGELTIAAASCEVFAETGLQIKERSTSKSTFLIELANGFNGYLPTPEQHAWGGYETWPARSSYLEVDAAPKIRDGVLDLLASVAN
jgi:neutral/alkaline ceramidase-like enzyme